MGNSNVVKCKGLRGPSFMCHKAAKMVRSQRSVPSAPMLKGDIEHFYALGSKAIGEGTFGTVFTGIHRASGTVRAIKAIERNHGNTSVTALYWEIATMKSMDHPNVVKLFEAIHDRQHTYLALELCEGGELVKQIIKEKYLPEKQAAPIMRQVLQAVSYVHGCDVAHRDLKPDNFLLLSKGGLEKNTLKLIDFGFAAPCKPGTVLRTLAGTTSYLAPQVISGQYDKQCDMWSLGVMLYSFLSGRVPFHGQSQMEVFSKIQAGRVSFDGCGWSSVSSEAKGLVLKLLEMSPTKRWTAGQALRHRWVAAG